jgi:hypothetical protein
MLDIDNGGTAVAKASIERQVSLHSVRCGRYRLPEARDGAESDQTRSTAFTTPSFSGLFVTVSR